jgi:hypothetical protein
MYRLITTISLLLTLITSATGQSIPSYWMNIYALEDYYNVRNQEAVKIDVQKTGFYSSGEMYKEKWLYNFSVPNNVDGELFMDGELKTKFTFISDNSNRRVKNVLQTNFPLLGWKKESVVFEYSAESNKSFEKRYDGSDQLVSVAEFWYDSLNHLARINQYDPNGHLLCYETANFDYSKFNYLYTVFDSSGSLISQKLNYCNIYSFSNIKNSFGDYTKVVWPTSPPEKKVYHEFSYKYDEHGNWTERVWFVVTNGEKEKRSIVKRKIKYKS